MKQKEGLVSEPLYTQNKSGCYAGLLESGNIARIVVQDLRPHIHQSEN